MRCRQELWLVFLMTARIALAGTDQWTNIGPDGGSVYALAIDPQNALTVYAATGRGLFKSTDGGDSWRAATPGMPNNSALTLAIDPQNPSTLYAEVHGQSSGVLKSVDGGNNWTAAYVETDFFQAFTPTLAMDPQNPKTLYVGTNTGIAKTTNGGESWTVGTTGLPFGANLRSIAVDPRNSGTVYAGYVGASSGGVFKSTDGGTTWRAMNSGVPAQTCSGQVCIGLAAASIAIDPQNSNSVYAWGPGGLFTSTNGGTSWNAVPSGLPFYFGFVSLAIDPQNPSTIYVTMQGFFPGSPDTQGFYKSTDRGASWVKTGFQDAIQALAIDPRSSGTLYAATNGRGIYKSTDGANTWRPSNSGLRGGTSITNVALDPQNPGTIYAATSSGLFKTMDGGVSWNGADSGLSPEAFGFFIGLYGPYYPGALAVDPRNTNTLYAGIIGRGVFKSVDGGANWSNVGLGGQFFYESLAIDPQNPGTVYAAGFSARTPPVGTGDPGPYFVFKTTDGGSNWAPTGSFRSPPAILAIDTQNPNQLYMATSDEVFKSADGGQSWSAVALPDGFIDPDNEDFPNVPVLATDPQNSGTLYVGGYGGLFKSTDGGESWTEVNVVLPSGVGIASALAIDPRDSNIVYVSIFGRGIFRSADGGASWSDANFGPPLFNVRNLIIGRGSPGNVYAGNTDGVYVRALVP